MNTKGKSFWKNQWNYIKIVASVVVVLIVMIGLPLLQDSNVRFTMKEWYTLQREEVQEFDWTAADFTLIGQRLDGNTLTTETVDPQLEKTDFHTFVYDVEIAFADKLKEDTVVQVFYADAAENYTETKSYYCVMQKGMDSIDIHLEKTAEKLRVDIGDAEGITYSLASIKVNSTEDAHQLKEKISSIVVNNIFNAMQGWMFVNRIILAGFVALFLCLHFWLDLRKMYAWIFRYRWLIAGLLLVVLVANKYHGDSSSIYDAYVQPGEGSEFVQPVYGRARSIRSDEWMVDTPRQLSSQYLDHTFGKYNDIVRGTKSLNDTYLSFATIGGNPLQLTWAVLGVQYGFCFSWWAKIFLTFLLTLEWFLILTKRNKLMSTLGACMIVFSSFFMWWGLPGFVISMHGALVCVYYFIRCKKKWQKIALGVATPVCTAYFVDNLYPAWQVSVGFIVLVFLAWLVITNWDQVKALTKFDWIVFGIALVFCGALVASYMLTRSEYTTAIMNTVYPGARVSTGGYSVTKLYNFVYAWLFPYREYGNASEAGVIMSFFPIPVLCGIYCWIRMKKKDFLLTGLLGLTLFFLWFNTLGFPTWLAKITMMSYAPANRAVDILGYIQVYLIVLLLTKYKDEWKINKWFGLVLGFGCVMRGLFIWKKMAPEYFSVRLAVLALVLFTALIFFMLGDFSAKVKQRWCIALILVCLMTGGTVRPIVKGFDCIYSKPVASEITKLAQENPDAKWVAYGDSIVTQSYLMACGASTINSVNTYPNLKLWESLDPKDQYEEIYNRYAHIDFNFTEEDTNFTLVQEDRMKLWMNYQDLEKTGVAFIYAQSELDMDNPYFSLNEVYGEGNAFIYQVQYN